MFVVCQNNKYGFCRHGKKCEKIHLTDICEQNESCRQTYWCDKRHPYRCYYFERYKRCKFGSFCAYSHVKNKEMLLEIEIKKLNDDIVDLKNKNIELMAKLEEISQSHISEKPEIGNYEDASGNIVETNLINVDLATIIRENSWHRCEKCDYKSRSKRGIRVHTAKMHTKTTETQTETSEYPLNNCEICDYIGKTKDDLEIHVATAHSKCEKCDYTGKTKVNLEIHVATAHSKFNEYSNVAWYRHCQVRVVNGETKGPLYNCSICGKTGEEEKDIRNHYGNDHKYIELETRDQLIYGRPIPTVFGIVHNEDI